MTTTLTADGQITLPAEVRQQLNLSEGDEFKIDVDHEGRLVLSRSLPITALQGLLAHLAKGPTSIEDMDEAMARGIADHVESSKW